MAKESKESLSARESHLKVRPLDDRIVVEPLEAEEKTAGGILLPDTAKQKPQRGRVLAVGPGKLRDNGERTPVNLSRGDEVLYGRYGGSDIQVEGREIKILRESDILAKVVK
jgi:chaperonin GroES